MIKILLVIPLFIFCNFLYGQVTLVEYDAIGGGKLSKDELIITDSISIYNNNSDNSPSIQEKSFLIKKHLENRIYMRAGMFNKIFYVADTLHNMKWQLTSETKKILNEQCFSATSTFRGRSYIAYYTPGITNSDGPWKFGGLPGLILEVKSDDNLFQFVASKIVKNYSGKVEPVKMDAYKFMDWNEYVYKFIATIDNFAKLVRSNGSIESGSQASIKIDAPEIIYPKVQQGEGILLQ
ncbi:MAG: GLPGLI family protein [Ferruginibacter sp.]